MMNTATTKPKKKGSPEDTEINFVHQGTIHTETIQKEKRYEGVNFKYDYTFQPNTLYPYAEKPQLVSPSRPFTSNEAVSRQSKRDYKLNKDPISEAFTRNRIEKIITQSHQIPKDKYDYPVTSAQEIGWYSKPLVDNSKWNYPVSSTPISRYVDNYFVTMKINPFKLPSTSILLK